MDMIAGIYSAQPFWVWAGLAAALLAIEVVTGSGWLLWASASAAATAAVVGVLDPSVPTALLVFALLTIVSTLLAHRYLPRQATAPDGDINDNVARLVGHRGAAVKAFAGRAGRVFIDGKEWAAELDDGDALEAGASVEVVGVDGSRLKVRRT
ncbi:MAG: NfeD family protein [Alphaproteobacteria bacterium]|nr:NfeD family protein [Alphaproteobacteria bacterium]MBU1515329.1 NfeD family protein [Alphaproteobacteria bacterium]MBU2095379.1 NfeD family protein [Alphaproteobacteria bacterium]MBU2152601.1 NfeD family protein [Alphaproteobacteria bacterium]MBU2309997.1 NfeD family protein [Alphaproteobacteria bacterium]